MHLFFLRGALCALLLLCVAPLVGCGADDRSEESAVVESVDVVDSEGVERQRVADAIFALQETDVFRNPFAACEDQLGRAFDFGAAEDDFAWDVVREYGNAYSALGAEVRRAAIIHILFEIGLLPMPGILFRIEREVGSPYGDPRGLRQTADDLLVLTSLFWEIAYVSRSHNADLLDCTWRRFSILGDKASALYNAAHCYHGRVVRDGADPVTALMSDPLVADAVRDCQYAYGVNPTALLFGGEMGDMMSSDDIPYAERRERVKEALGL